MSFMTVITLDMRVIMACGKFQLGPFLFVATHMSVGKCSPVFVMTCDLGHNMTMIRRDYVLVRPMARVYILVKNMIISRN